MSQAYCNTCKEIIPLNCHIKKAVCTCGAKDLIGAYSKLGNNAGWEYFDSKGGFLKFVPREMYPWKKLYIKGTKKTCSKCNKPLEENRVERYCKACRNENNRLTRVKWAGMTEETKKRHNARLTAYKAFRRGKIKELPCKICGAKAERHHPDYDKPLEVEWLCRKHHLELHKKEKENNEAKEI